MASYPPMILSKSQRAMLDVIFNTFIGPMTAEEEQTLVNKIRSKSNIYHVSEAHVSSLSKISAASLDLTSILIQALESTLHPDKRLDLTNILDTLSTRDGSYLLTGHSQLLTKLSQTQREQVLISWRTSPSESLRTFYKTFASLCLFTAYSSDAFPLQKSIGYEECNKFFEEHPNYTPVEHERLPMMTNEEATTGKLSFDVVIVGSGAGGGVAAAELATAGYSVLVIEKGTYYHQSELVQDEAMGFQRMYDTGTVYSSVKNNIDLFSGGTFGGGTAINYSVSLKPQHFIREDWSRQGLSHFMSPQFSQDLDRVFERIGASQQYVDNKTSQKMKEGCNALGYHFDKLHLNTGGKAHYCIRCSVGCKSGVKNSTLNTWLKDAYHHGARFLDKTMVTKIIIENKKAIGVECQVHGSQEKTFVLAKRVIAACGAIRTPTLLKSSGLSNSNIGRHLRLQAATHCLAYFDETIKQQSEGNLISCISHSPENWKGDYYGAKIEDCAMLPGTFSLRAPWYGSAHHKELMLKHKSSMLTIIVLRDKDSVGKIIHDPKSDVPLFDYKLGKHDEKSFLVGIEANMKIFVAAGARELYSPQPDVEPFIFEDNEPSSVNNPRFIKWLKSIHKAGIKPISVPIAAGHQMSSCRMGVSPKTSATKPTGETWEVKHLYVADSSLLPTALGVNPMVTIEATSLYVSRQIKHSLQNTSRL